VPGTIAKDEAENAVPSLRREGMSRSRLGMTLYASTTSVERLRKKEGTNIKIWFKTICVREQNIIRRAKMESGGCS